MSKITDYKIFGMVPVKHLLIQAAAVWILLTLAGVYMVYTAYKFGATCVDTEKYEDHFIAVWLIVILPLRLFCFGGISVCILFGIRQKWKEAVKLFLLLIVIFIETLFFSSLIEPVQFFSLRGFLANAPQKIDIEAIQNWLDSAEIQQTEEYFKSSYDEVLPDAVNRLHPKFVSIYNHNNQRAIALRYGNRATSSHFGIVVTNKNAFSTDKHELKEYRPIIRKVNDYCYIWCSKDKDKPLIARILGIEIE